MPLPNWIPIVCERCGKKLGRVQATIALGTTGQPRELLRNQRVLEVDEDDLSYWKLHHPLVACDQVLAKKREKHTAIDAILGYLSKGSYLDKKG